MIGRLILIVLQVAGGWGASHAALDAIKVSGDIRLYIFAIVAAVVIFFIGIIGSIVLRGVGRPGLGTLTWSVILALSAAALWSYGPMVFDQVPWNRIKPEATALIAAMVGYMIKR